MKRDRSDKRVRSGNAQDTGKAVVFVGYFRCAGIFGRSNEGRWRMTFIDGT